MQLNTHKKSYKPKTKNKNDINIVSSTVKNIDLISNTPTHDILHFYNLHFNILID
jgi:hypothetical protein